MHVSETHETTLINLKISRCLLQNSSVFGKICISAVLFFATLEKRTPEASMYHTQSIQRFMIHSLKLFFVCEDNVLWLKGCSISSQRRYLVRLGLSA